MSSESNRTLPAIPSKSVGQRTGYAPGDRSVQEAKPRSAFAVSTEYELAHSRVVLEPGPVGVIARIERGERTEYAGPVPEGTIDALKAAEVRASEC